MQDIYTEYSRMRESGMDAKTVLNALRQHIEALSKPQREELAGKLRAWEARPLVASASPASQPVETTRQIPRIPAIKPLQSAPPAPAEQEAAWVTCPACGKSNQRNEVFCYSCGQILDTARTTNDTRHFNSSDSSPLDSEYFGPDSVLALRVRGSADVFEVRPQNADYEMIVGRSTSSSAMSPDIDLEQKGGADLGVSRMHLSIRYDADHQAVLVSDLGSANGSFLNGQRLLAKEIRVLRHGDELRLGKLVLVVSFRHPSNTN